MNRSYYSNSIEEFLVDDDNLILGHLTKHHSHTLEELQKNAWVKQVRLLKDALKDLKSGQIYFEFAIPRMGKRVDNVLVIQDLIFVLEFKVGDTDYQRHCLDQVVDYCLDLQNFHEGSHFEKLIPILVATNAKATNNEFAIRENLFEPLKANSANLGQILKQSLAHSNGKPIDAALWEASVYKPTPTIIEAAQALYKGHNVADISRHDAGTINLSRTTTCINQIIHSSKTERKKSICFLTGVPGAGKTLAGLNIANERMKADENEHAVFLSGNGPLVSVLREALARDAVECAKQNGSSSTKKKEKERAVRFIQNIHHFRDDNLLTDRAPIEKVVVFDEAQRAWSKEQASTYMRQKKGIECFNKSEPEFLIEVMNRHEDWCTVICLIGGGQEINTGEAGISEWLETVKSRFPHWHIHYSSLILSDNTYLNNSPLRLWLRENAIEERDLHLSVSVRSFRSEKVSELMHNLLECNTPAATKVFLQLKDDFPIYLTRDLTTAKNWLRSTSRGTERIGVVASSGGRRLRPLGIDVKNKISAPEWFLNPSSDVRSSNYLEDVATEFDIQGLEIDFVCLAWDINLYFQDGRWHYQRFEGTKWQQIHVEATKSFLINTYRVLLTRARQGLVILVPTGDERDTTRPEHLYDQTFEFLQSCGIPLLPPSV